MWSDVRYDRDNAAVSVQHLFNIQSDNVFNIQANFEASEQETYRIRLINLGSPLSYRLKIFQLV